MCPDTIVGHGKGGSYVNGWKTFYNRSKSNLHIKKIATKKCAQYKIKHKHRPTKIKKMERI